MALYLITTKCNILIFFLKNVQLFTYSHSPHSPHPPPASPPPLPLPHLYTLQAHSICGMCHSGKISLLNVINYIFECPKEFSIQIDACRALSEIPEGMRKMALDNRGVNAIVSGTS